MRTIKQRLLRVLPIVAASCASLDEDTSAETRSDGEGRDGNQTSQQEAVQAHDKGQRAAGAITLSQKDGAIVFGRFWESTVTVREGTDQRGDSVVTRLAALGESGEVGLTLNRWSRPLEGLSIAGAYALNENGNQLHTATGDFAVSGTVTIEQLELGRLRGTFEATMGGGQTIQGAFSGATELVCDALVVDDAVEGAFGARFDGEFTWMQVDVAHPFCEQYL